jgi:hypothetical protein
MSQQLPELVAHADWSVTAPKRWIVTAQLQQDGRYKVNPARPVGDTSRMLADLLPQASPSAAILVGFDFPIGLPISYAERAGITRFLDWLHEAGDGKWVDFFSPASTQSEIRLERPFYPLKPGNTRQLHLLTGLGVGSMDELRRVCELAHSRRRAASPLFWTLGGQQVGKAAISGWREVLKPALVGSSKIDPDQIRVWPFSGKYSHILEPGAVILVVSYPAEYYSQLGLDLSFPEIGVNSKLVHSGKRSQICRIANSDTLLKWADSAHLIIDPSLADQIRCGFGPSGSGEDPFDALIGLFGMLNVVLGFNILDEPSSKDIQEIEGWIFGQHMENKIEIPERNHV